MVDYNQALSEELLFISQSFYVFDESYQNILFGKERFIQYLHFSFGANSAGMRS